MFYRSLLALVLVSFLGIAAQAETYKPANVQDGILSVGLGYSSSDNNQATAFDPNTTLFFRGDYGFMDMFEVNGLLATNQFQNVTSGTSISGTPLLYGIGGKYLVTKHFEDSPVDLALALGFSTQNTKVDFTGGNTDTTTNNFSYGAIVSKLWAFENWPKIFIPYGSLTLYSNTATSKTTFGGATTTSTTNANLTGIDLGFRLPVNQDLWKDLWVFVEYNSFSGFSDGSTNSGFTIGGAYDFDLAARY